MVEAGLQRMGKGGFPPKSMALAWYSTRGPLGYSRAIKVPPPTFRLPLTMLTHSTVVPYLVKTHTHPICKVSYQIKTK